MIIGLGELITDLSYGFPEISRERFTPRIVKWIFTILFTFSCDFFTSYSQLLYSNISRAMFEGNFRERISKAVELPGKEKIAFNFFLHFMYPLHEGYPNIAKDTLAKVLGYLDEYQVR